MKHKQNGLDSAATDDQALTSKSSTGKQAHQSVPTEVGVDLQLISRSVYAEWQSSGSRTGRELRRWMKRLERRASR